MKDENKEIMFHKSFFKEYQKKIKARSIAKYKIKIPNNQICENCKIRLATQRHHSNYNKPLEVKFLCAKCNND